MAQYGLLWLLLGLAWPAAGWSLDLELPDAARLTRQNEQSPDSYQLPIGPWAAGQIPTQTVEGRILQQAWRIDIDQLTTLQLIRPIEQQLTEAGFEPLFDCRGDACGGFDFRFGTRVMAAPDMFVDLFDYRFLSARAGKGEYVSVLVSRAQRVGYIQIIYVSPDSSTAPSISPSSSAKPEVIPPQTSGGAPQPDVVKTLLEEGHVILSDLEFASGSSNLGPGPYASLQSLAAWLKADPARRLALVGHTDTVGGLEANIALSRRRATAVMQRLSARYEIAQPQMEANGMGYLSPVRPNLTRKDRDANRRVEAVLLSIE